MRRGLQLLSCILLLLVADTLLQLLYSPANGCSLSALPSLLLLSTDHTFVENYNDDHQPHLFFILRIGAGAGTFRPSYRKSILIDLQQTPASVCVKVLVWCEYKPGVRGNLFPVMLELN